MPEITLDDVPGELRRSTLRLTGAQVVVSATIPLNAAIGATEAVHLSHHAALSGTSVGFAMLASVGSLFVLGRVADRLGRRPVLAIGLSLLGLGCAITGVAVAIEAYALFVVGAIVFGLGSGPSMLCRAAAADLYPAALRGRGVGIVASGGAIGAAGGPLLAAAVEELGGTLGLRPTSIPFLTAPLGILIALALVLRMRSDPKAVASDLRRFYPMLPVEPPPPPPRPRAVLAALPPARAAIVAAALAQAAMVGVMANTSPILRDDGWGAGGIGLLMAAHFIGMFALSVPVGRVADRIGRRSTIAWGVVICAIGAAGTVLFAHTLVIVPFFFLLGLGWSGTFVAGTSALADVTTASERGTLTSANDMLVYIAGGTASIGGGFVAAGLGFPALGIGLGLLLLLALPGLRRVQEGPVGVYADAAVPRGVAEGVPAD